MSQLEQREICSVSIFLLYFDWVSATLVKEIFFLLSVIQVLISSGNTFTNTPRNSVLPAILGIPQPIKLTCKINLHSGCK